MRCVHGSDVRPLTCAQPVMPGLIAQAPALALGVLLDLHGQRRARADQRHLAAQHVEQVRQLVERGPCAATRPTRVMRESFSLTASPAPMCSAPSTIVRSFSTSNGSPSQPDAPLAVDRMPGGLQADGDHREREQRAS